MSETLKYNHENNGEKDYPYTQLHEVGEFFREQCKDPLDAIERNFGGYWCNSRYQASWARRL